MRRAWLVVVVFAVLALPGRAAAQDAGWLIESFDAHITVREDGTVEVVEEITVDFGGLDKHGIFRVIPVRYPVPADPAYPVPEGRRGRDLVRAIEIDDIRVESTAPDDVEVDQPGPGAVGGTDLSLRIGDPDRTVSGRQTYRIAYRVRGMLNSFETHEELYWNVNGFGWGVPILRSTARVEGPDVIRAGCFQGYVEASQLCDDSRLEPGRRAATFAAEQLAPHENLTVVVGFAPGAVAVQAPILLERWSLGRALTGSPWAWPLTALTALLGLGGVAWLAFRQGRDRITRGDVSVDGRVETGQRRGLLAPRTVPVQFRPPEGLRPGQLGVLVDERVDPVDVSATIVDLAVRGHLRIEEVQEKKLFGSRTDWRLINTAPEDWDGLAPYERRLLEGLFAQGTEVELGDLKGTFHEDYDAVSTQLYQDAVAQRWFASRPDRIRSIWLGVGIAAAVVAGGLFVAAVMFTTIALAAVPLVLAGLALAIAHRWMPHRTPKGSRMLTQTLGFRDFITTAEAGRMEFAEAEKLFVEYLPYAVVFGATDRWARTFEELGVRPAELVGGWYVPYHVGAFDLPHFSSGLSDLSSSIGNTLPVAPASSGGGSGFSSGGGFSGGGFGGGGGGSW